MEGRARSQTLRRYRSTLILMLLLASFIWLGVVGLYWRGIRPGRIDGVRMVVPAGALILCAERPGLIWKGAQSESRAGYLHLAFFPRGTHLMRESWGVSRIRRSGYYYSFEESVRVYTSPLPIITGSKDRGGIHLCCGYPQAVVWQSLLTGALGYVYFRHRRQSARADRLDPARK